MTSCECAAAGFCARHACNKSALYHEKCRTRPDWFAMWEAGKGPGQPRPASMPPVERPPLKTLDVLPCVHRGPVLRQQRCECLNGADVPIYACGLPEIGECQLNKLVLLKDHEHERRIMPACDGCRARKPAPDSPNPPPRVIPPIVAQHPAPWFAGEQCCFVDYKGRPVEGLQNLYRGASCFLVCGGPSTNDQNLSLLNQRGILTAAVNQAGATQVRPNVWFSVDQPAHFHEAIWRDPAITKIVKWHWRTKSFRERLGDTWVNGETRTKHCPNTWFLKWRTGWNANTFLTDPRPTWGTDKDRPEEDPERAPTRSVMLVAVRVLFQMGIRKIYLLGADFHMTKEQPYSFGGMGDKAKARSNNRAYGWMNRRWHEVRPHLEAYGLQVLNCAPGGNLTAFERLPFEAAVEDALAGFPREIVTKGLY